MSLVDDILPDRLLEQSESWTPWDRRAWEPGTLLCLRELSDASSWVPSGVLSAASVDWYRRQLVRLIGQDHGLASGAIKSQLDTLLRKGFDYSSQSRRRFDELVHHINSKYLASWQDALASEGDTLNIERASRFLVGHVVDAGYDTDWLRRRIRSLIQDKASALDIVDDFKQLVRRTPKQFTGWVIVTNAPQFDLIAKLANWVDPSAMRPILASLAADGDQPMLGGLRFEVQAMDPISAARDVGARMDRLVARTRYLPGRSRLQYVPLLYTADGATTITFYRAALVVKSMVRTGILYSASISKDASSAVDDALVIASPLLQASDTAAVAAAWASLESLLVTGSDSADRAVGRAVAADRAAALIAASWPRSELTRLSHHVAHDVRNDKRLLLSLNQAGSNNFERSAVLLEWLTAGRPLEAKSARDQAGVLRMRMLVASPFPVLSRVRGYMTGSLRRLYRQRNIILHGGSVQPIATQASLRTAAPLVAAVLDRLVHAYDLNKYSPLDAVARAEVAIDATKDSSGWPLSSLVST